jgi:hypothetical protein
MKPSKQLLEAWKNAVALGNAWLVFAYARSEKRFRELQRDGEHLGLQTHMEHELLWRICDGEFQAFGIEDGSDAGPILIPKYYFSKTVEVDWDRETVEAFGKKFHEVRVQGKREREPADEARLSGPLPVIDAYEITAQRERERLHETPPDEPEPSHEPPIQAELESTNETLPSTDRLEEAPSPLKVGRPSKGPEIEQAIELLLGRGIDLAGMNRPKAYAAVKDCAANELNSNTKIGFHNSVIQRCLFRRLGPRR